MMLLIGSRAMSYWFNIREPVDWDVICTHEDLLRWMRTANNHIRSLLPWKNNPNRYHAKTDRGKIEFELATPSSSALALLDAHRNDINTNICIPGDDSGHLTIADPATLVLIKRSHLHLPIRWWKHISDYHMMKGLLGHKYPWVASTPEVVSAIKLRTKEIDSRQKKSNLAMSNTEFFAKSEEALDRTYVHDDIHKIIAFDGVPLYQRMKTDQSKAAVSQKKFTKLGLDLQIKSVQEEALVIALERKIIPAIESGIPYDPDSAFRYALCRICTTLTGGWFRDFAIEHVPQIMDYPKSYVDQFLDATKTGKIRRKA